MEGWHAKRCANKVGIYKSEGKYIKPIPATFSYYSKKCRDRALYIYFHFYLIPCLNTLWHAIPLLSHPLFAYSLACHPYSFEVVFFHLLVSVLI